MADSARLRLLKGSVVIMGVLILVLSIFLVGELMRRAFVAGGSESHVDIPPLHAIEPGLPEGARVVDLVATEDHVVIHAVLTDGATQLFVLNPKAAAEALMANSPQTQESEPATELPLAQ